MQLLAMRGRGSTSPIGRRMRYAVPGAEIDHVRYQVGGDTWTEAEIALFRTLDTPGKVQDFLDTMPMNQVPLFGLATPWPV